MAEFPETFPFSFPFLFDLDPNRIQKNNKNEKTKEKKREKRNNIIVLKSYSRELYRLMKQLGFLNYLIKNIFDALIVLKILAFYSINIKQLPFDNDISDKNKHNNSRYYSLINFLRNHGCSTNYRNIFISFLKFGIWYHLNENDRIISDGIAYDPNIFGRNTNLFYYDEKTDIPFVLIKQFLSKNCPSELILPKGFIYDNQFGHLQTVHIKDFLSACLKARLLSKKNPGILPLSIILKHMLCPKYYLVSNLLMERFKMSHNDLEVFYLRLALIIYHWDGINPIDIFDDKIQFFILQFNAIFENIAKFVHFNIIVEISERGFSWYKKIFY